MQKQQITKIIKKVALYGGSFDPPHNGHFSILQNLLSINFINQIWLLPSGDRTDKKLLFNKQQRFAILQKIVNKIFAKSNTNNKTNHQNIILSDQQINLSKKQKRMIPTYQLLTFLEDKYRDKYEFYFVIGTDLLESIHKWENYQGLLQEKRFIVYPRLGYAINIQQCINSKDENTRNNTSKLKNYHFQSYLPQQISSSYIKKVLLTDQNIMSKQEKLQKIKNFVDQVVIQQLRKKGIL